MKTRFRRSLVAAVGCGVFLLASCMAFTASVVAGKYGVPGDNSQANKLIRAIRLDETELAIRLIAKGEDVNGAAPQFDTPLAAASRRGNLKLVEYLLDHGAKLEDSGSWALAFAAANNRKDVVELLVKKGVRLTDINAAAYLNTFHTEYALRVLFENTPKGKIQEFLGRNTLYPGGSLGPFLLAVHYGYEELARLAFENGYEWMLNEGYSIGLVKSPVGDYITPLEIAMLANRPNIVRYLIERGADVNRKSFNQEHTPLMTAAYTGNIEFAKLLLDKGADANAKSKSGSWDMGVSGGILYHYQAESYNSMTPLIAATLQGHEAMVDLLLSRGADVNGQNSSGGTALGYARRYGRTTVAKKLLAAGARENPLATAILAGDVARARSLMAAGFTGEETAADARGPMPCAVRSNSVTMVDLILEREEKINAWDRYYALSFAIQGGNREILERLLKRNWKFEPGDRDKFFLDAVWTKSLAVVKLVTDAFGPYGKQALNDGLVQAVKNRSRDIAAALLDQGADPNYNSPGSSPLVYAAEAGDAAMTADLLARGAKPDHNYAVIGEKYLHAPLLAAVKSGHPEIGILLLKAGANPNITDGVPGESPLLWAAAKGYLELARELVARKADVNFRSKTLSSFVPVDQYPGFTALMLAAFAKSREIVVLLLKNGADPNLTNCYEDDALTLAVGAGDPQTVKILLDGGARK